MLWKLLGIRQQYQGFANEYHPIRRVRFCAAKRTTPVTPIPPYLPNPTLLNKSQISTSRL